MRFQCPECHEIVSVDQAEAGSNVQCGRCQKVVPVPASRTAPGAVIADFIIIRELGRGGMGIVYLSHQISLDRSAALKVLAESFANNTEFVVGFIKEARAAAKLNHPHIVQAYAVGEDEGLYYFAMENVDGKTMKEVLAEKKIIPVEEATQIIQQIAEALDYAWKEQRLVHRDIKPENTHVLNGLAADPDAECAAYDQLIRELGGVDLQLLGMGHNGHIAFNEPGDNFGLGTHVVSLSERTIDANQRFFESRDEVPRHALSMGIKNIMNARRILMVVSGEEKADIVCRAFAGPVTKEVPASVLQLHPDVTLVGDKAALHKLVEAGVPVCG